ncbi:MAG: hypothetical protein PHO92_04760 [Candidatus Peribacteraceae bacterium]|nr:hypothetical protein [Candidatus Peribacteraceae bacterium]
MSNHTQSILKKVDIALLILFPVFAVVISLAVRANFFTSILLFFGLPSLWFSLRTPSQVLKTLLFSLLLSLPLGIVIDYIAALDHSWFVPRTIFPLRLFGAIPLEDILWGFFFVYSIVIFYEHFLDQGKSDALLHRRMKHLAWPVSLLMAVFIAVVFSNPDLLAIPYAYFWIGAVFFLVPSVLFLSFFPRLLSKFSITASYFFLLALLFECTGLQLNQWVFPGDNFIGWVELFGYRFPFEEFFFWFVLGAVSVLSYYEFFDDDRK